MTWWRRHWRWLLAAGAGLFGFTLMVFMYALRKRDRAIELQTKMRVMLAASKAEGLRADREARQKELEENEGLAKQIDQEIREARRETVALVKSVDDMSDIEIANAFKELGY